MADTTGRGYGWRHQQARRRIAPLVASGSAVCTRCRTRIWPGQAWDLDHSDDRSRYLGPAHRSCNRRAGAEKGNAARTGRRVTSENWLGV